jgi:cysteine desulfurase
MSSNWSIDPSLCSMVAVGAALYFFSKKRKTEEEQHQQQATKKVSAGADTCAEVTASPRRYAVGEAHPFSSKQEFKGCVYLDYNATTPVFPEVTTAMMPFLTNCFGNPSSSHIFSAPCRQALHAARMNVGALVNAKNPASEIYFTSCGTESDNRAVDIALHHFAMHRKRLATVQGSTDNTPETLPHVITCKTEHPAVICYLRVLVQEQRIRMTVLPVNAEGFVSVTDVLKALTPHTALVTIMHSNNEVGTVQPIREIGLCVKQYNAQTKGLAAVLFHSDGAQSLGKLLVDVQACELDMFTIVGHKYGAPKGVAALYIRTGVEAPAMLVGGGQERGIRSGK